MLHPDDLPGLRPVLGHPRVLEDAAQHPGHDVTVLAMDGTVAAVAAFEPLYGSRAEAVVACAATQDAALAASLLAELADLAAAAGLTALELHVQPGQAVVADGIAHARGGDRGRRVVTLPLAAGRKAVAA